MCGQECAFRVLAWCFGLFGMLDAPATTAERVARLVEMLAAHADRIEGTIEYSVSQKNNHAIIEGVALWTLGVMFPLLSASSRWGVKGEELIEREGQQQIYGDGAYVQHSLNYHRLVLQGLSWALVLGDSMSRPFSPELWHQFTMATRFLYQLTDETSGGAPNYGSNDGARLFRLDACGFEDYRPTLALAYWLTEKRRACPPGLWDEPLFWMCGIGPFSASPRRPRLTCIGTESGYFTLRGKESWAATRCCTYEDRPAQADMLHVDLWWRGMNIVADPGTYSYNSPPPWDNSLSRTAAHNTVTVDGLDQMERGSRFTWFHWNTGEMIHYNEVADQRITLWEGRQNGYARRLGITHRRAILMIDDRLWVIVDDLVGAGVHRLSSHWLFPKAEVVENAADWLRLRFPVGLCKVRFATFPKSSATTSMPLQIMRGSPDSTLGWFSPRYLQKEEALSVVASEECSLPARRFTLIGLDERTTLVQLTRVKFVVEIGPDWYEVCWADFPYPVDGSSVISVRARWGDEILVAPSRAV
jgi:hypothetical protein